MDAKISSFIDASISTLSTRMYAIFMYFMRNMPEITVSTINKIIIEVMIGQGLKKLILSKKRQKAISPART